MQPKSREGGGRGAGKGELPRRQPDFDVPQEPMKTYLLLQRHDKGQGILTCSACSPPS